MSPCPEAVFRRSLTDLIPQMRAFARGLCHNPSDSEDLTQEALLKALRHWQSYQPDTNLRAWVFTIMRNHFYSATRVKKRYVALDDQSPSHRQTVPASADARLHLNDLRRALMTLPDEQREAILLIGASDMTYEEASGICGASTGTLKSRVSRGRQKLMALIQDGVAPRDTEHPCFAASRLSAEASHWARQGGDHTTTGRTPRDASLPDQA